MAYDADLAERIRALLASRPNVSEKRMFGGLAFLVDAKMAVAANSHGALMVRIDPGDAEELIRQAGVERMVMRGKELDGWLTVAADALGSDAGLAAWVERGVSVAHALTGAGRAR